MLSNCGIGEDSWESLEHQGDQTLKEINTEYSSEALMLKLKLQYFGHLMQRADSLKKTLILRKIEGRRRRGKQRTESSTQWTWVWANSRRQWRAGRPGVLQSMGLLSQTWLSDWTTKTAQTELSLGNLCWLGPPHAPLGWVRCTCGRLPFHPVILLPTTHISLVLFSSVAQSCPILCDPMNRSMPGLPVHHQLPESTQTHVHWVGVASQPSHPLSSPSPPAPNLSQNQGFFKWVSSSPQVAAKVLEFQLQHQSFQWTFRVDFL